MEIKFNAIPKKYFGNKVILYTTKNNEEKLELSYVILSGLIYQINSQNLYKVRYKIRNKNISSDFDRTFNEREIFTTKDDLINYIDHYKDQYLDEYCIKSKYSVDQLLYYVTNTLSIVKTRVFDIVYEYSIDGDYEKFMYLIRNGKEWCLEKDLFNSYEEAEEHRNKLIDSFLEKSLK